MLAAQVSATRKEQEVLRLRLRGGDSSMTQRFPVAAWACVGKCPAQEGRAQTLTLTQRNWEPPEEAPVCVNGVNLSTPFRASECFWPLRWSEKQPHGSNERDQQPGFSSPGLVSSLVWS